MKFRTPHTDDTYYVPFWLQESGLSDEEYLDVQCRIRVKHMLASELPSAIDRRLEHEMDVFRTWGHIGKLLGLMQIADEAKENGHTIACPTLAGSLIAYLIGITSNSPLGSTLQFEDVFEGDPQYRLEVSLFGSIVARNLLFPRYVPENPIEHEVSDYLIPDEPTLAYKYGLSHKLVLSLDGDDLKDICKVNWTNTDELTLNMARQIESNEREIG